MDKYQKMVMGFLIAAVATALIYIFVAINEPGGGGSSSDDTSYPFFIFFPSWIAIFIPIIARQRQEKKMKEEELRNQLED